MDKPKFDYGVFVKRLPPETTRNDFTALATAVVPEAVAVLRYHKDTGAFRGFGFVYVPTRTDQTLMIQTINGYEYGGRKLLAEVMKPRVNGEAQA